MKINLKRIINKNPRIFSLARIFGGYAVQPFFLLVHLTLDCNCQCENCYQRFDKFYFSKKGNISPAEYENILKDASRFFIKPWIHLFGGEPLLSSDFAEIIKLTDRYGFKSSLTTNGVLLDNYLADILNSNLNQINISIDGLETEHDRKRGFSGSFKKAIAGINNLSMGGKGKAGVQKIINVNCLITKGNHRQLIDIAGYFQSSNVKIDTLSFQHPYFDSARPQPEIDLMVLKSQLEKLSCLRADFKILLIPSIKKEDLAIFYSGNNYVFKEDCFMPWLGLSILPNLEVTPGGGVLGCNRVVGDLKEGSMKTIWNSKLMKNFRKDILAGKLPVACSRCCHRQYY